MLKQQALGTATNRPRERVTSGPDVHLNSMRASAPDLGVFGFKTYSVASGVYRFLLYLYDAGTGDLLCILEANRLGQLRTGAASGVAAKYMAREDASVVGVLGSGFQARTQLEAVCKVRDVSAARVYSPTAGHRRTYADEMSRSLGVDVTAVESPALAVAGADILVTVTDSSTPVFEGAWLGPGMHVTAVGGADPYVTELDGPTLQRADVLVVDDVAQARIESGELIMATSRGLILWERVRELWQIVGGMAVGRTGPDDITLFKSLGMALWDIAAAKVVYEKAVAQRVGMPL